MYIKEEHSMKMMDAKEIISFIQNSTKATPVKVYVKGELDGIDFGANSKTFINGHSGIVFGEWSEISVALESNQAKI